MSDAVLLTNPRSRANRRDPEGVRRLVQQVGLPVTVVTPNTLDALADHAAAWRASPPPWVAVHGGDGTLHRVVTALLHAHGDTPLPPLAVLPAGTMNIVANSLNQRGPIRTLLTRLHDAAKRPTHPVWTLKVTGTEGVHYGFLFGNGIIGRFLEVYYEGSEPTPAKAAAILARGALSAPFGGKMIRRLTRPFSGTVRVDGHDWGPGPWTAVAAGTVEQLGLGFRAFHLAPTHPGQLHAIGIGSGVAALAWDLPRIFQGRGPGGTGNRECAAHQMELHSDEPIGFMIDGDFHQSQGPVTVQTGPSLQVIDLSTP